MGCCASREASDGSNNSPYAPTTQNQTAESSRNITSLSPHHPSSLASPRESHVSHHNHHHPHPHSHQKATPSTIAPNTPLKPLDPRRRSRLPDPLTFTTSTNSENPGSRAWTRKKLARERNDWWDTRTGAAETWAVYRRVIDHLQKGETQEAQTLLDAAGCTCPDGKAWHAIYDEHGDKYVVQGDWLVFEPNGLVEEEELQLEGADQNPWNDDAAESSPKDKGKGRADDVEEAVSFKVMFRLSTNNQDCSIQMKKGEKVRSLQSKLSAFTGLDDVRHRIVLLGRVLHPSEALPMEGPGAWKPGNIVNVMILEGP